MRLRPLHDWVLIRRKEPEGKTAGGIIIPDSARDKPAEGIVEAVGPGRYKKEPGKRGGRFVTTVLKPGQRVFFSGYAAKDITLHDEDITLIREVDILGTLEGAGEITVKKPFQVEVKGKQPLMVQKITGLAAKKSPTSKVPALAIKPQGGAQAKAKKAGKTEKADTAKRESRKAEKKTIPEKKTKLTEKKRAEKKTVAGSKPRKKTPVKKTTTKTLAKQTLLKRERQKKNASKKTVPQKTKAAGKRGKKSGPKAKKSYGK